MGRALRGTAGRDEPVPDRPELHLSGPRLRQALESLIAGSEEQGGVERYVDALKLKAAAFGDALAGGATGLKPAVFAELCALMPSVRRRIGPYLDRKGFATLQAAIGALLEGGRGVVRAAGAPAGGHAARHHRDGGDPLDPEQAEQPFPPMLPAIRAAAFWMECRARCAYRSVVCTCV